MHTRPFLLLLLIISIFPYAARAFDDAQAHAIVLEGTPRAVKQLVDSGYDLDRVYQCKTLLTTAIQSAAYNPLYNEHPEYALQKIQILLNAGANYNQDACPQHSLRPLFWAVTLPFQLRANSQDILASVEKNIDDGIDYCDIPHLISKPCKEITPEEKETIREYINDLTTEAEKELNPYFARIAKFLIQRGANLDKKDEKNQTILHYLVSIKNESFLELLKYTLSKNIPADPLNKEGYTPIFFAYGAQNPQAANLLIEAGANAARRDKDGYLPIHAHAVTFNNTSREDDSIDVVLEM